MKKNNSFVLCGLVACVAMLAGCVSDESDDPAVAEDSVLALTEADQKEGAIPDVEISATLSFTRTCRGNWWFPLAGTVVTSAGSASCQRRDGTWTGPSEKVWFGFCWGNLANIDGEIVCNQ